MENYHRRPKTSKPKFEDDNNNNNNDGGSTSTKLKQATQQHNRPQHHGVMVISPNGKIRTYVTRALEVLTETDSLNSNDTKDGTAPAQSIPSSTSSTTASHSNPPKQGTSSSRGVLTIKAQGKSITKAVTVAEILKRRMEGSLHQFTEIGQVTEHEIWDPNPDQPNLDPLTVFKHRPTIRIRLSKHLPSTAAGTGLEGVDMSMPGANIPRDEHPESEDDEDGDEGDGGYQGESWPGAILDRDAAARRFVGYQAPTGSDIYL
ncbi:hypothetical protein BGX29_010220 [Mortierella sp. GBA35]|nr:hypothetical protein BGX29_010220 [Mortierella sp. GBA35]KAG0208892.1 hypothetical protein BGX33_005986 [Mortierella sp. NVP41]